MRVGILGFQGCIEPHEVMLKRIDVESVRVRTRKDLDDIDALILPGGESTTMLRFLKIYDLIPAIRDFSKLKPTWGICAGAILLAREVHNPAQDSIGVIDISAHRNFYGSQLESFSTELDVVGLAKPIVAQFIRAPLLNHLANAASNANARPRVLASLDNQPVFFAQDKVWACSFHVELGEDASLHSMFVRQL